MDHTSAASFFNPLGHRKILHLVRHAQGIHNVEAEKSKKAVLSPQLLDAQLSPLGWQQVGNLRKEVRANGLFKRVELVVTSPMSRTIQTAIGVFGEEANQLSENKQNCQNKESNTQTKTPTSEHNPPPIVAMELCREQMGVNPCDKRRSISNYQSLFPSIDFSQIESDDDILWKADSREHFQEVGARGRKLMKWLWRRKEKEIVIVSHGIFLQQTLLAFRNESDELTQRFGNCELRSVTISVVGSDSSTNCCNGNIPRQLAPKENVTDKKMPACLSLSIYIRQP